MHLTGKTILDGHVSISRISNLKTDAPEVEREFMAGKSGAQKSERPFTAQFGRIMGLEQSLNNEVMCSAGLIGITKRDGGKGQVVCNQPCEVNHICKADGDGSP